MDVNSYYKSLSEELLSLKDRIRYIINDGHWQTDGEWKESVLRSILSRHLPSNIEVGSGFIVSPDSHGGQTDILIYDSSTPIIFKEGHLAFVPANGVRGIVEVKTKIHGKARLREILRKLADQAEFISNQLPSHSPAPFIGLFAYESTNISSEDIAECLYEASQKNGVNPSSRVVNHLSINIDQFAKYWSNNPLEEIGGNYCHWHVYNLPDKSFGYFIQNIVHACSNQNLLGSDRLWFPKDGKEPSLQADKPLFSN